MDSVFSSGTSICILFFGTRHDKARGYGKEHPPVRAKDSLVKLRTYHPLEILSIVPWIL